MAYEAQIAALACGPGRGQGCQVAIEDAEVIQIEDLNVADAFVNGKKGLAGNSQSFYGSKKIDLPVALPEPSEPAPTSLPL